MQSGFPDRKAGKPAASGDEPTDELLALDAAAAVAGLSRAALRQAYREGRLEGVRQGRKLYVSRSGLLDLRPASPAPRKARKKVSAAESAGADETAPEPSPPGRRAAAAQPPEPTVPSRLLEDALRQLEAAHYELRHLIGQNAALQFELRGHQRALSDGQDLARAREAVHEASASEHQAALKAAAVLMQEERQSRLQAEAEAACLRARLAALQAERDQPWWRRLLHRK